ncbi:unnamed protein product [Urochloa humidicola]
MGGVLGAQRLSSTTQTSRVLRPALRRLRRLGKPAASSPEAAATALVLGNDDLLREVLLRLALPASLARAACVCKRWLRVASDPTFLHSFRTLHPPRLLGSFPSDRKSWNRPSLLPCPGLPAELAAMARRANSYLSRVSEQEPGRYEILDVRNGRVLFYVTDVSDPIRLGTMICAPLLPEPPVYLPLKWLAGTNYDHDTGDEAELLEIFEFLPEDGGDGLSYFEVRVVKHRRSKPGVVFATLVSCQAGVVAGECHATPPIVLPKGSVWSSCSRRGLLSGGKFYVLSKDGYILGLDLVAMSLFYIDLPGQLLQQGRDREAIEGYDNLKSFCLSRGEGSKFYLIHTKGLKVFVWLHDAERGSNANAASNWVLVDTICLLQVFAPVAEHDFSSGGCRIHLLERGGDNAEFVYLSILDATDDGSRIDYLLHIKSRAVEKVFEEDRHTTSLLYPFTMVWPAFPAVNE